MAKVFMCDCCGEVIKDPYAVKFREYYSGLYIDGGRVQNKKGVTEGRIDLCKECYSNLAGVRKNLDYKKVQEAYIALVNARDNDNQSNDDMLGDIDAAIGYLGEVLE